MSRPSIRSALALPGRLAGRLGLYTINVLVVTAVGVFTIPVLIRAVGAGQWAQFAFLQTLAQIALIVVMYGWGVVGPSLVAAAGESERADMYADSLWVRGVLYLVVAPVTGAVGALFPHADVGLSFAGAAILLLPGFSAGWFFVGQSRPGRLLLLDSLPMLALSIVGMIAAAARHSLWPYLLLLGAGYALAAIVSAAVILRGHAASRTGEQRVSRRVVRSLHSQRHAVTATVVNTLYVSAPMLVVKALMPASLPTYALMDRLYRYGSIAYGPIQQFFQGWIPGTEGRTPGRDRRMIRAVEAAAGVGVAGTLVLTLVGPAAARIFSHGEIRVTWTDLLPLGVAFAAVCVSTTVGYACLALVGRVRLVAVSTGIGVGVGLPLIVGAAWFIGRVPAVAGALALSEVAVATFQCAALRRYLSSDADRVREPEQP